MLVDQGCWRKHNKDQAVLIGKDGGEKLAATHLLGPEDLFPLIDPMPMRQEDMRRRT